VLDAQNHIALLGGPFDKVATDSGEGFGTTRTTILKFPDKPVIPNNQKLHTPIIWHFVFAKIDVNNLTAHPCHHASTIVRIAGVICRLYQRPTQRSGKLGPKISASSGTNNK